MKFHHIISNMYVAKYYFSNLILKDKDFAILLRETFLIFENFLQQTYFKHFKYTSQMKFKDIKTET